MRIGAAVMYFARHTHNTKPELILISLMNKYKNQPKGLKEMNGLDRCGE